MKKHLVSKNGFTESIFIIAFIFYLFISIMNASFFTVYYINKIFKISMIMVSMLLVFKEILTDKSRFRDWVYLFLVITLTILIYMNLSGGYAILPLFLFIYSSRDIELKKIMNIAYYESIILFIIIILSAKTGIIMNYIETGGRIREYLGFRYSLYSQALLFNITALDLYIKKDKTSFFRCLILLIINYYIFKLTNSRLSFYLSLMLIIGAYLNKRFNNITFRSKIISYLCVMSYIICCLFSIYITYNYNPNLSKYANMNEFLGGRLYYGNAAIKEYGINSVGHEIILTGNGLNVDGSRSDNTYNYVDCLYVVLLLRYGYIFLSIFIVMMTSTCLFLYKRKEYYLLLVMIIFALHGIVDDLMIYLYYNTFWLIVGKMMFNGKNRITNK